MLDHSGALVAEGTRVPPTERVRKISFLHHKIDKERSNVRVRGKLHFRTLPSVPTPVADRAICVVPHVERRCHQRCNLKHPSEQLNVFILLCRHWSPPPLLTTPRTSGSCRALLRPGPPPFRPSLPSLSIATATPAFKLL